MIGDSPDFERDPIAARQAREGQNRVLLAVGAVTLLLVGAIYAVGYYYQEQQAPTMPRRPASRPKAAPAPRPAPVANAEPVPAPPVAARAPRKRPAAKPRGEEPAEPEIELPEIKSYDELQADIAAEEKRRAEVAAALEKAQAEERERRAAERRAKGLPADARDMSVDDLDKYLRRGEQPAPPPPAAPK